MINSILYNGMMNAMQNASMNQYMQNGNAYANQQANYQYGYSHAIRPHHWDMGYNLLLRLTDIDIETGKFHKFLDTCGIEDYLLFKDSITQDYHGSTGYSCMYQLRLRNETDYVMVGTLWQTTEGE